MLVVADHAGFLVSLAEEAATAIGAGVVIGGFVGATGGVVYGWSRKQVESHALRDGYIGAVVVLCAWLSNLCIVYAARIWTT
jgi:hypothetical protein